MNEPAAPAAPARRAIRSFVRREGRITAAQSRALEEHWGRYGVEFHGTPLDLDALFGRRAPRTLEIGFGDGETLVALAARHPERDYLGLEVHAPGVGHCLLRAAAAGLTNVRVLRHDAVEVLEHGLPPASLDEVLIYFPDPWPKKRHHKRRLLQPAFAALLATRLAPGGRLRLATDWAPYAEWMRAVLDPSAEFVNEAGAAGYVPRPAERPETKFERRGARLGQAARDLAYRRR
ncbi:MAG: tRNA (guanosine(46)-N7)-methyltransferase TrmB [Proteobacteria bacterium]|nr:tRNA (guanosine(46)-N7)-methyltransferase TrmB [Pseudomonadota bacterium]